MNRRRLHSDHLMSTVTSSEQLMSESLMHIMTSEPPTWLHISCFLLETTRSCIVYPLQKSISEAAFLSSVRDTKASAPINWSQVRSFLLRPLISLKEASRERTKTQITSFFPHTVHNSSMVPLSPRWRVQVRRCNINSKLEAGG